MVFRKISRDFKERAIWLSDHGYVDEDIAEILGISTRSIERWRDNLEDYGDVVAPPPLLPGRPHTLDAMQTDRLLRKLEEVPDMYLDEIHNWLLVTEGLFLSPSCIHQLLRDTGMTYKMLKKSAAERDEEERTNFRDAVQTNIFADMIVTVDETSKDDRTLFRRWGRSIRGTRAPVEGNFLRGERFSMVAALSLDGYVGARVVPGSVDGEEFFDFIVYDVV